VSAISARRNFYGCPIEVGHVIVRKQTYIADASTTGVTFSETSEVLVVISRYLINLRSSLLLSRTENYEVPEYDSTDLKFSSANVVARDTVMSVRSTPLQIPHHIRYLVGDTSLRSRASTQIINRSQASPGRGQTSDVHACCTNTAV
jgi:hypothetical protein